MAKEPARTGSGNGSGEEGANREVLPRLTEVVPDYAELSPFYHRPSSAPAAGIDSTRHVPASTRALERNRSDIPSHGHPSESPLPPLKGATVRTFPGAGSRPPYQSPFEVTFESRPSGLNTAIERGQSDRPSLPNRQTSGDAPPVRSPPPPEPPQRFPEARSETKRPSVYDPIYDVPPQRRESRSHLPPIDVPQPVSPVTEAPQVPQYQAPLPPLRTSQTSQHAPSGSYSPASSRYAPYSTERPSYEQPSSRRRYSQTHSREYHRPASPSQYSIRSPPTAGRQPPIYAQESYPSYPPPSYARGTRRPSYTEERRPSRQESIRYPAPIPYGSYPPGYPYEYGGGRGYYEPHHPYMEYPPDNRRLSQQEPGEQVAHLGVPERSYRPQMIGGPTSPSIIRVQPQPGITSGTPGKRRGNLPKESKEKLKLWLGQHVEHPYPTEEEKKELAAEAGMTMGQINNWFINARRRTLPRIPGRTGSPTTSRNLRRRPGDP